MTPAGAVARLTEIVAARADLTEDEIYGVMAESGIPRAEAFRAYHFTIIAWGRHALAGRGVRFPADYFCFDAAGDVVESGPLAEQPYFVAATALAARYARFPGAVRLVSMSSDVNAVKNALNTGSKPENLVASPVALFVEGPTPTAIDKAGQFLSRRILEAVAPTVIDKARQLAYRRDSAPATYTHPVHGWSVAYPADWLIDSSDPNYVRIRSGDDAGLCGIHSLGSRWNTLDELTDWGHADTERFVQTKGLQLVELARRRIVLPNNITGNDVLTQILPRNEKSRRIYVQESGRAFVMDCKTWPENWETLEPVFDRIVNSFTLPRGRPAKKWWEFWK